MNLIFNELSFYPLAENEVILKSNFLTIVKTFEKMQEIKGFKNLVFPNNISDLEVTSDKNFSEWVFGLNGTSDKNKILSFIKRPFVKDLLEDENTELQRFYYSNTELEIKEIYCSGLATAYLKNWICVSINSHRTWDKNQINFFKILNEDFDIEGVSAYNICDEKQLSNDEISKHIENITDVELRETHEDPDEKKISLRDDHGKDKLLAFSKKLVKSKYIISVINSLPFNPKSINLIKNIYSDGKIEMVLYWENAGYGLIVQTTGETFTETKTIAKILQKAFDK